LPGAFNPALNTFAPGSVYWVCGLDENGEIAVAQSARRYDWPDSSMCDHGSELLYGDLGEPRPCYFDCPPARLVRGTVSFSGALWIRPDFRRRGLGGIVAQISRTYALATWGTDWLTSLLQRHQLNQGLHLAYGFTEATFSIKYPGSPWGDLDFALLRQHPLELVA